MNFKKLFIKYCKNKALEINNDQINIVELIHKYYLENFAKKFFFYIFKTKKNKKGFYLHGDVGVGKTMILNLFYNNFDKTKKRFHFNEFMINFHDFAHQTKKNKSQKVIDKFVKILNKKFKLIYFDELQVTNIVDAMILGSLFKKIFDENIKVIFSSNIKINDLYKDGLQRDQFLPFIKIMKKECYEEKLSLKNDYRKSNNKKNNRYFFPLNEYINFKVNKLFRKLTKNKIKKEKILITKGRKFIIKDYYEGIARFDFKELCNRNVGAEDYIKIAKICDFMIIEFLPNFKEYNADQQQRFITLIDIIYEQNLPLLITCDSDIKNLSSSKILELPFKRTLSRLYELTSLSLPVSKIL